MALSHASSQTPPATPIETFQDTIKDRVSIHERPKTVDGRTEGGHWEGDLIICKRTRPVLVLHERKSRVTLAARLAGKTAAETISVMLAVFARIEPALRKSITFDNDTAFAQHALLRTMRAMTTWFCDAYASWQKGGVENANGRLRRWLPRQIDIDQVSDEEIQDIVVTANLTPRKCLGFKTPFQAILKELAKTCKSGLHSPVTLAPEFRPAVAKKLKNGAIWVMRPRNAPRSWSHSRMMRARCSRAGQVFGSRIMRISLLMSREPPSLLSPGIRCASLRHQLIDLNTFFF